MSLGDIIHSDISLSQMYVSNLNYCNGLRNIEKKIKKKTLLPKRTADIIVIIDTNANFHSVSHSLSLNSYS